MLARPDGATDGTADGTDDGTSDGTADGVTDGSADGAADGSADGTNDGTTDGMTDGTTDGVSIDAGVEEDINLGTRADPPGMTAAETDVVVIASIKTRNPLGLLLSLIFVLPMALRRKNA